MRHWTREPKSGRDQSPGEDSDGLYHLFVISPVGQFRANGAAPRPDNRSGWLEGETPDVVSDALAEPHQGLDVRLWDPSTQLRFHRKRARAA